MNHKLDAILLPVSRQNPFGKWIRILAWYSASHETQTILGWSRVGPVHRSAHGEDYANPIRYCAARSSEAERDGFGLGKLDTVI